MWKFFLKHLSGIHDEFACFVGNAVDTPMAMIRKFLHLREDVPAASEV